MTPINILLVEDNPDDVLLTTKLLAHAKVMNNIDVARDGEEALAYLLREGEFSEKPRPDLILLDLNLPRKNGRELLEDIRNNPDLKDIPVVIQSASDVDGMVVVSEALQADYCVVKPVDLERLISIVDSIDDLYLGVLRKI